MTPYAWIDLLMKRRHWFGMVLLSALIGALAYSLWQPDRYRGEVLLMVTRTAVAETSEYDYDHFYRFQADERLAESLARALESAPGKRSVAERAGLDQAAYRKYTEASLRSVRLGTNLVSVRYETKDRETAARIGEALPAAANALVAALNEDARESTWFTVLAEKPVITLATYSLASLIMIGAAAGLFVAVWVVLLAYFWEGYREHRKTNNL